MQKKIYLIALLGIVILQSGCTTIEHRSEDIPRQPLPPLMASTFVEPKTVWCATDSAGTGKMDAKLQPAVTTTAIIIADYKGRVLAYDRTSGTKLWEVNTGATFSAGPVVLNSIIYLGTREGNILAYRLEDGSCVWNSFVSGEVLAVPRPAHNMLFVNALDSSVTALNLQDGKPIWRYCLNTPNVVLRQSASPQVSDHHVVVGFSNGKLLSFHRLDGSVEWERQLGEAKGRSDVSRMADISADPVIAQGIVYAVSYRGRLAALSLETGQPIWERSVSSASGLSISSKWLYVSETDGSVRAMSRHSGDTLWKQPALGGRRLTKPVLWQDVLVVGDDEGYCHFINPYEGTPMGRMRIDNKGIDAAPLVMGEELVVLGRSGKLVVLCR